MSKKIYFTAILITLMTLKTFSSESVAVAQDEQMKAKSSEKGSAEQEQAPKVKIERGSGGRKVFRITTGFVIEGRIQKPNAFYVLQRSQINYDWAKLTKNFMPRVIRSVDSDIF